jgi:serine kinase of HPr protein (carbohydrate metabolism regulator)
VIRHAGVVALRLAGRWIGALIEGPSGAGKSDLMLRALDSDFRLVADDRAIVWASGGALYGRAPDPIAGLIESRGQGVLAEPALWFAEVRLLVTCEPGDEPVERMPDPASETIAGIAIASLRVRALEASAPAKLRRAMQHLGAGPQQAYQARSFGGPGRARTGDTL